MGGTTPDDEETGLGDRGVHRVWFFDISAGPEAWGGGYDVTSPDLDGDGEPDARIPPAWEYADGGYRPPEALAPDLSALTRYAAINLMFTSSPIYPPAITPARLPDHLDLDVRTYEALPGVDAGTSYLIPEMLVEEVADLYPDMAVTPDVETRRLSGRAERCYLQWIEDVACYADRPQYPGFANLFVDHALHLPSGDRRPRDADRVYNAQGFTYATTNAQSYGFLGYADDNWTDGTQSFVFGFLSPRIIQRGYGLTTTLIHEYGHHLGMSHPHDGYDSEEGVDYHATGRYFLAWAADEHNSMMSYIDVNWDFSQFDRDNAARHQAAGYIGQANLLAGRVLASRHAVRASANLLAADAAIGEAGRAMAAHDYPAAWTWAREAYEQVLAGADAASVDVTASYSGWDVQPKPKPRDHHGEGPGHSATHDRIGLGTKRDLP